MMNLFKNYILKLSSLLAQISVKKSPRVLYIGAYICLAVITVKVASATDNYLPDTVKLFTKATKSIDLYAEPDFNFQTFNTYTLELSVRDQAGQPAQGVILRVFSTDDKSVQSKDGLTAQRTLLGIVRTDQYGSVYQTIEISQSVKQVLLELNSQSPDNQFLIELAGLEYISHDFEVD